MLLDTHLLLWALGSPARLPTDLRRQLDAAEVFVSAVSMWEISIKSTLGEHAAMVARLPLIHRDPFDRMLLAQAFSGPMNLFTRDETSRAYESLVTVV